MTENISESIETLRMDPNKSIEFCLCDASLDYVQIHAFAKVSDTYFEINATNHVQCDHSFGGGFTSYHHYVFDPVNSAKFYQSLVCTSDLVLLSQLIKQRFGDPDGLMKLENHCQERSIVYHYTYRSEE